MCLHRFGNDGVPGGSLQVGPRRYSLKRGTRWTCRRRPGKLAVAGRAARLSPAAAVPFVVATGGPLRWVVLGFCIATGPWLTSLALTLTSGIAPQAMGTLGEKWTAHELRRLKKRGSLSSAGVTLPGHQIDHVAVGPSGVLVVETKWSAESWLGVNTTAYMRRSLKSALEQAKQSRLQIVSKLRGLVNDGDVHAVLVLWSAPGQSLEEHTPEVMEGATVLLGSELRSWLDQVEEVQTGSTDVETAWAKIEDLAFRGDASMSIMV